MSHWQCSRLKELALREWSDGWVLLDEAQGKLLCLSVSSGAMMDLFLRSGDWTAVDLAEKLVDDVPTDDDVQMVENVLMHFQSLSLIERLSV